MKRTAKIRRRLAVSPDLFEIQCFINKGTYGSVHRALKKDTGEVVAIKSARWIEEHGKQMSSNFTLQSEISLIAGLKHENVIEVKGHFLKDGLLNIVMECMQGTLQALIVRLGAALTEADVKAYMLMMLRGLAFLHEHRIMHRDLKPNNILISDKGILKICDFGFATRITNNKNKPGVHTGSVVVLCYRSPELLLGAVRYGAGVDVWAAGCIMAEMMLGYVLVWGWDREEQLLEIYKMFGLPNEFTWPGVSQLPHYDGTVETNCRPKRLCHILLKASKEFLMVVEKMLTLNPAYRYDSASLLEMKWFSSSPLPTPGPSLPIPKNRPECKIEQNE